jgi:hypothetical protein
MAKRTEDFNRFISDHVNINQSRLDRLNKSVAAVAEYLSQRLEGHLKVERQGSYALRTIIKPVNNHEYDADLLLFMELDSSKSPRDYIDAVYRCLKDNDVYAEKIRRKTRCVVVDYAGDFHLDIVPCVDNGTNHYICNRLTDKFEITDGTGFRDWFNRKNKVTNGNLKLVTRLLKYLRDHKQTFTAPSILLTTLIGNAVYDWEDDSNFKTVPDTLVTVSRRINDFLQLWSTIPTVANPVLPQEDFTRHWDETKYLNFRDKFNSYTELICQAYEEVDPQKSLQLWRQLFGENFGTGSQDKVRSRTAAPTVAVSPRKPYARNSAGLPKHRVDREHSGSIRISGSDLDWLNRNFPGLRLDLDDRRIVGDLSFCATYDSKSEKLWIGDEIENRSNSRFLCDTYSVIVELDSIDANGWPAVREVGGRYLRIADKEEVEILDLHFFPDGRCCLGINLSIERRLTIERFVQELLIPFLYRLSYVDAYGIDAARRDLWGEYSHGDRGLWQHADEVIRISNKNPGRNAPCPCGSGKKYKLCHLQEVEAVKVAQSSVPAYFFSPESVV